MLQADTRAPELDGLRGVAVLMVMISHLYVLNNWGPWEVGWLKQLLGFCHQGVDVFFVLSGFLIGGIILRERDQPRFFTRFYHRRLFRIAPPYLLLLVSFWILLPFVKGPAAVLADYLQNPAPAWVYLSLSQNLYLLLGLGIGPAWLAVTWSLSVEEFFYLLAPVAIRFSRRPLIIAACLALILASPLFRHLALTWLHNPWAESYFVLCRADGLSLGILLALLLQHRPVQTWGPTWKRFLGALCFGLVVLSFAISGLPEERQAPFALFLPSLYSLETGSVLLFLLVCSRSWAAALFRMRWLRGMGEISYFCYLFHLPFHYLCFTWAFHDATMLSVSSIALNTLLSVVLLVTTALLSRKFIELPLIHFSRRKTQSSKSPLEPENPAARTRNQGTLPPPLR